MSGQEIPERLDDLAPAARAMKELREVPATVQGDPERFLAASAVVAAAVRHQIGAAALVGLRREVKVLGLMTFGEFDKVAREAREERDDGGEGRGPSQATRLVNLAASIYDFGVTVTGDPFAVPREGGYVARMLRGGRPALRPELSAAMFAAEGVAPNSSALADALAVLEGQAQQADPVELALRTARQGETLLLDLGDVTGRVVAVSPDGWEVIDRSPVLFRRTAATLPLPEPVGGHSLDDTIFALLNVGAADRALMEAVLVHYLWPDIGHVIARLTGRDGTAKTSATKIMRSLIDPCAAPTRAMPRDETDWIIAVNAALVAAIDNVSAIPDWLSDAMCRASTGEGLMRRKLYSDQDVSILSARRIVILNGIDATIRRADFARRIADFELDVITKIRSDSDVEREWSSTHPYALGALLDLAVTTLKRLPGTILVGKEESLTMSVFAGITKTISEPALKVYISRLGTSAADIVDADPFAKQLIKFIGMRQEGRWAGLASKLIEEIPGPDPLPRGWPKDATRFGAWARRLGRVLESAAGIRITKEIRTSEGQPYTVERISSEAPDAEVGEPATSATQLQAHTLTSGNTAPIPVAARPPQLHQSGPHDQRECSSVADVATALTLQDRVTERNPADGTLALLQDPLGAELIEPAANGHSLAHADDPAAGLCIGGCGRPVRHGCRTCWDHAHLEVPR